MSDRYDKLRRLQGAVDAMWSAAREAEDAFNTDRDLDLQAVIDEQDEELSALKAEVVRLKELCHGYSGHNQRIIKRAMEEEVERLRLRAENERLRKAGDEMDEYLKRLDGTTNGMLICRRAWYAAKGVQS